jgi:hypothetical protein
MLNDNETPPVACENGVGTLPGANVNKMEAAQGLIAEWLEAGKNIRSNIDLVNELNRRYPGAGFHTGTVAQAKQRLRGEGNGGGDADPAPSTAGPVAATPAQEAFLVEETEFMRQLRGLVCLLGREAVKGLIDTL